MGVVVDEFEQRSYPHSLIQYRAVSYDIPTHNGIHTLQIRPLCQHYTHHDINAWHLNGVAGSSEVVG